MAPDWQDCVLNESFAFVIVYRVARWCGFRPAGRVTFFSREKSNQKRLPLHPAPAAPGFVRSIAAPKAVVQGPSLALYDSRRIPAARPLRNDSAHPSERGGWCRLLVRAKRSKAQATPTIFQATRTPSPVRRPSGGVAQGDARHGRRARSEGAGTPLRDVPPERHRSEGSLAAGQTRMSGWPSLWLLSLGQTRESDSAGGPKPEVPAHSVIALICKLQA